MHNVTDSTVACMNTVEAADYISVAPETLRSWRDKGDGPIYVKLGKRRIGYLRADLDAYLMERRVDPRSSLT